MTRFLYCRKCGDRWRTAREDNSMGWRYRKAYLVCLAASEVVAASVCDSCNVNIGGEISVAMTMWNINTEGEPGQWETDYGTVLSKGAVELTDKLQGKNK